MFPAKSIWAASQFPANSIMLAGRECDDYRRRRDDNDNDGRSTPYPYAWYLYPPPQPRAIQLPCNYLPSLHPPFSLERQTISKKRMMAKRQRRALATPHYCIIACLLPILAPLHNQHNGCHAIDVNHGVVILSSAVADTTQILHRRDDNVATNSEFAVVMKRHHLVCFLQRHPQQYHHHHLDAHYRLEEARESCCSELHHSGFLTERHNRKYCLDHIALVPTTTTITTDNTFGNAVVGGEKSNTSDNLVPAFYLSWDDEKEEASELLTKSVGGTSYYKQRRQLKRQNEEGGESIIDGGVMEAFSPFHLIDLTSAITRSNGVTYPLWGYMEGSVSNEGGMHRSYHQTVHLHLDMPRSTDNTHLGHHKSKINANATIFLPISESVFIDADDPLHVAYENGSPDGVYCMISIGKSMMITTRQCSIQFVSPETIDIEQPAFASRQYIVAYEISAELDLLVPNEMPENELEISVDYVTTLHTRYPPLISSDGDQAGHQGVVPIVVQKPVLYSASVRLDDQDKGTYQQYLLQTDPGASTFTEPASKSQDVIIIHVAAGLDDDHAWVTIVTLSLAMLGGFVLMRSLDSISIWC